jgi:nucleotide-binding universal stress UspA family protein
VRFPLIATAYEVSVPTAVWEGVRKAAQENLEKARNAIEGKGVPVTAEVCEAPTDAVQAIASAVEAHEADVVVMGTHGHRGIKHAFLGSAHFSCHSDRATKLTCSLAKRLGASVDLLHVIDDAPYYAASIQLIAEQIHASAARQIERVEREITEMKIPTEPHLLQGSPSEVIADLARTLGSDLIVMGTRGNSGLKHLLLGSVAERTLRMAPCSVLAVNAPESLAS